MRRIDREPRLIGNAGGTRRVDDSHGPAPAASVVRGGVDPQRVARHLAGRRADGDGSARLNQHVRAPAIGREHDRAIARAGCRIPRPAGAAIDIPRNTRRPHSPTVMRDGITAGQPPRDACLTPGPQRDQIIRVRRIDRERRLEINVRRPAGGIQARPDMRQARRRGDRAKRPHPHRARRSTSGEDKESRSDECRRSRKGHQEPGATH